MRSEASRQGSRLGDRRWWVVGLALLMLGCVQKWTKPGGTSEEFQRDREACERVAEMRKVIQHQARFERCMQRRGYEKR